MTHYQQTHRIRDGAFGMLHAVFGLGVHHVEIRDETGKTVVGRGEGSSEAAARQAAWKDVHQKESQQA
jgi:hypothetical protein